MTTIAQDPGVTAVTDPSEPGKQAEPEPRPGDYTDPVEYLHAVLDHRYPMTAGHGEALAPVVFTDQARSELSQFEADCADDQAADAERTFTWWDTARHRTFAQLHAYLSEPAPLALTPIPAPAAVDGESAAAGAVPDSGPGLDTPREPGPAPAGDEAA